MLADNILMTNHEISELPSISLEQIDEVMFRYQQDNFRLTYKSNSTSHFRIFTRDVGSQPTDYSDQRAHEMTSIKILVKQQELQLVTAHELGLSSVEEFIDFSCAASPAIDELHAAKLYNQQHPDQPSKQYVQKFLSCPGANTDTEKNSFIKGMVLLADLTNDSYDALIRHGDIERPMMIKPGMTYQEILSRFVPDMAEHSPAQEPARDGYDQLF